MSTYTSCSALTSRNCFEILFTLMIFNNFIVASLISRPKSFPRSVISVFMRGVDSMRRIDPTQPLESQVVILIVVVGCDGDGFGEGNSIIAIGIGAFGQD